MAVSTPEQFKKGTSKTSDILALTHSDSIGIVKVLHEVEESIEGDSSNVVKANLQDVRFLLAVPSLASHLDLDTYRFVHGQGLFAVHEDGDAKDFEDCFWYRRS